MIFVIIMAVIFLVATIFLAILLVSMKKSTAGYKSIIESIDQMLEEHTITKVDQQSELAQSYNKLIAVFEHKTKNSGKFEEVVDTQSTLLKENVSIAEEKADVVRAAIDEVRKGLNKQLIATEESTNSIEDMTSAIEDLSVLTNDISEQSTRTLHLTESGNEKIQQSVQQMQLFNDTINAAFTAIKSLDEKSNEISKIVKVITSISEQINLLALNAAIEAARAGEHGKGFAVVADEVRKLAEQSNNSASEVSNIVKNIQDETSIVVTSMEKSTGQLSETNATIDEIGKMFEEILNTIKTIADNNLNTSASTEEISSSAQQIVGSMQGISFISRESVEMFDELVGISDEELRMMATLQESIKTLVEYLNQTSKH